MRILLVNAFHYLRGGVERTVFDEARWLAAAGHEVSHFAIRHPENLPSADAEYFAPTVDYGEGAHGVGSLARVSQAIWSRPAAAAIERLIAARRPEIAHVHAPSRYLTPSVIEALARARVPLVMTLHDFKPWCTNRIMFAHGAPCERCRGGAHWHALATGCVQDSRATSAVAALEAYVHDARGAYRAIARWIAPSRFAADKAIAWGADAARVRVLSHGVEPAAAVAPALAGTPAPGERYVLFAGRLAVEKGVRLLAPLAARLPHVRFVVAGDGPQRAELEREARARTHLRLTGRLDGDAFARLRAGAAAVIVPSLFYETWGYAVAEALLDARPVVASRIGALPELVEHEVSGLLVPPGELEPLALAVERALADPHAARWGEAGRERVRLSADPKSHVEGLLAIYREVLGAPARA